MKQRLILQLEELGQRLTPSVTNMDVPVSGAYFDTCTAEFVRYSGTEHIIMQTTVDKAGGIHEKIHQNLQNVTAVGDISGNSYKFVFSDNETNNLTAGGATEDTLIQHVNVIGQGSPPNEQVTLFEHFTFDANGNLTSFKSEFTEVCRG